MVGELTFLFNSIRVLPCVHRNVCMHVCVARTDVGDLAVDLVDHLVVRPQLAVVGGGGKGDRWLVVGWVVGCPFRSLYLQPKSYYALERAEVVALVDVVGQQRVEVERRLVPVPVWVR